LIYGENCESCGLEFELFMVEDRIWGEVFEGDKGIICICCFERMLGRKLVAEDFTIANCNFEIVERFGVDFLVHLESKGQYVGERMKEIMRNIRDGSRNRWFRLSKHDETATYKRVRVATT